MLLKFEIDDSKLWEIRQALKIRYADFQKLIVASPGDDPALQYAVQILTARGSFGFTVNEQDACIDPPPLVPFPTVTCS